jgi:hypothetical protein
MPGSVIEEAIRRVATADPSGVATRRNIFPLFPALKCRARDRRTATRSENEVHPVTGCLIQRGWGQSYPVT